MEIELKEDGDTLTLTNEYNDNDNYITIQVLNRVDDYAEINVDILELYSAVLSFITLKKKNEEMDEYYARRDYAKYVIK